MSTLLRKRILVATLVMFILSVSTLALTFTLHFAPTQEALSPAAQSPSTVHLVSSGSSPNIQDPRFCVVPLEGLERLTGKESTP